MNWAQRKLDYFNLDWWFLTVSLPWHLRHCCSATHPSLAKRLRKSGSHCPGKGEAGGQAMGQARSWGWGSGIREGWLHGQAGQSCTSGPCSPSLRSYKIRLSGRPVARQPWHRLSVGCRSASRTLFALPEEKWKMIFVNPHDAQLQLKPRQGAVY